MDISQARALAGGLQKFQPARSAQTIRTDQVNGTATVFKLVSTTPNFAGNFEYRAIIESDALGMFISATRPHMSVGDGSSKQPIQYTLANSYCVYRANISLIPALVPGLNLTGVALLGYEHSLIASKGGCQGFADPPRDPFGSQVFVNSVDMVTAPAQVIQFQTPARGLSLPSVIADEVLGRISLSFQGPLAAGAVGAGLPTRLNLPGTSSIFWISQAGAVY